MMSSIFRLFNLGLIIIAFSACGGGASSEKLVPVITPCSSPSCDSESLPIESENAYNSEEIKMVELMNVYRIQNSLNELRFHSVLRMVAKDHSTWMNTNERLTHRRNPLQSASDRIRAAGGRFRSSGEVIACGNSSASRTLTQWKNSSGHRAIVLGSGYRFFGVSRAGNADESSRKRCPYYWTVSFGGLEQ